MDYPFTTKSDLYTSSIPTLLPQIAFGDYDASNAPALSMGAERSPPNIVSQSPSGLSLLPTQHKPIGAYVAPQQQPSIFPALVWNNNNQCASLTPTCFNHFGQPKTSPFTDTQHDQSFLNGLAPLDIATWDFDWLGGQPSTAAGPSATPAQFDQLFDSTSGTQLQALTVSPTQEDILTCPQGCSATFTRAVDYRRHMLSHQPHKFKCVFSDCNKTFPRMDKLNDHFRQGHRDHPELKVSRASARTNPRKAAGEKKTRR